MLTSLLALAIVSSPSNMVCPVNGEKASDKVASVDYNGVRYHFCCGGCPEAFQKNPTMVLKKPLAKGKLIGEGLFDPVAHTRIEESAAKGFSDYKGVRYYFASADNKMKFAAAPAKFTMTPKMEVLRCPMSKEALAGAASSYGYIDDHGTRFYVCCPNCFKALHGDVSTKKAGVIKDAKVPAAQMIKVGENPQPEKD